MAWRAQQLREWIAKPELAALAARQGDPMAHEALSHVPLQARLDAERAVSPTACCQACAEGRACEGTVGACCQACAEGRACEGKPAGVGASDDSCYGCPPGMRMVPTPAAIPNRFICIFDNQRAPTAAPRRAAASSRAEADPRAPAPSPAAPRPESRAPSDPQAPSDAISALAGDPLGGVDVRPVVLGAQAAWQWLPVTLGVAGVGLLIGGLYMASRHTSEQ
jgi:hypothetical protein